MRTRTIGVEEELLVVDPETGRPVGVAGSVLGRAQDSGYDGLEAELQQQQVEIASRPCSTLAELADDLRERRARAEEFAGAEGAAIAALATSPVRVDPETTADPRYQRMVQRFGLPAREQLTCGCHIHVQVASDDEGVAVLDRIRTWLPTLLALSVNSPFWQEQDTGFASYRHEMWHRWPSAGPTEIFGSPTTYRATIGGLIATGTLLDDKMVYFDARLSERFPTVEIRVADVCMYPADAVLVAALTRALVDTAASAWVAGEPPDAVRIELLKVAQWRAARSGLDAELVDPRTWRPAPAWTVVDALLDHVRDALANTGDTKTVELLLADLRDRGTAARRQRRVHTESGGDWSAVVRDAIRQTRTTDALVGPG